MGRIVMLAAAAFVVGACAGDHTDAGYDSGAAVTQTAGGDVTGSAMSPAMVTSFLTTVNQGEVEAGELAQDKATNAQVKAYAQLMVTEHRQAQNQLQGAGQTTTADSTAGGQLTSELHAKHQQVMQSLQSTPKGRAFDSTYIAAMVAGHEEVLQRLQSARSGTSDAAGATSPAGGTYRDTGTTAGKATGTTQSAGTMNQGGAAPSQVESSVQMVQRHLDRAREIQRSLGGAG